MALNAAETKIADALLTHSLDLYRLDGNLRTEALRILDEMEQELVNRLKSTALTELGRDRLESLLLQARTTVDDYYRRVESVVEGQIVQVAILQASVVGAALIELGHGGLIAPTRQFAASMSDVLIQGAPSSDWWKRQSADTAFRFATAVRQGIAQGETNLQIAYRVAGKRGAAGLMDVSRRNAMALIQTSVQTVASEARMETFQANDDVIRGVHQLSTLDGKTSDTCIAYSGGEWDLKGKPINGTKLPFNGGTPRHWNCRSILVPILRKIAGLVLPDRTTRASMDGQVAASTTFDQFLERKGRAFQDEVLGVGRAQLWRDGKITLQQLLDLRGNPLSLKELQAKYG